MNGTFGSEWDRADIDYFNDWYTMATKMNTVTSMFVLFRVNILEVFSLYVYSMYL